jgi:hypothetical protein
MNPECPLKAADVRRRLEASGISLCAAASKVHGNYRHIVRVLKGERPGSRALLESLASLAETETKPVRASLTHREASHLIATAVHVFFLKRGRFDSEICSRRPPQFNQPSTTQ